MKDKASQQELQSLSQTGFVRLPEILKLFPVSRSTWWEGVRTGRYPASVSLAPRCTAWRAADIHALLQRVAGNQNSAVQNSAVQTVES